ncbi:MAG: FAD-dependent thymidylate synthase, partial [Oscillospiraceae bacterium]
VMTQLPHPTIQKFAVINAVIVGASRRFLAQITRHQNEVKFMSASLQYSDYSNEADFVVPYELLDSQMRFSYLSQCQDAMRKYKLLVEYGVTTTSAIRLRRVEKRSDYQRDALTVEAHDSQRTCWRNTGNRYVMLRLGKSFTNWPALFLRRPAPTARRVLP